jgi:hypothetical protein
VTNTATISFSGFLTMPLPSIAKSLLPTSESTWFHCEGPSSAPELVCFVPTTRSQLVLVLVLALGWADAWDLGRATTMVTARVFLPCPSIFDIDEDICLLEIQSLPHSTLVFFSFFFHPCQGTLSESPIIPLVKITQETRICRPFLRNIFQRK